MGQPNPWTTLGHTRQNCRVCVGDVTWIFFRRLRTVADGKVTVWTRPDQLSNSHCRRDGFVGSRTGGVNWAYQLFARSSSVVRALMGRSVVVIRRYKRCWTVTAAMRAVAECALVRRPSAASQLDISHTIGLHKSFVAPCRRRRHSTCEPSRHVYDDFAPPPDTCPLKITIIASSKQKHAFWQWRI